MANSRKAYWDQVMEDLGGKLKPVGLIQLAEGSHWMFLSKDVKDLSSNLGQWPTACGYASSGKGPTRR